MKSDLQVKFLSFMTGRKKGEGFTLIELLVVIIIIGILAAIALPSFLNQANKAKQSEAKQYVGTIVRTQQAYYLENSKFASSLELLSKPVAAQTTNYLYSSGNTTATAVSVFGTSRQAALRSYAGGVAINPSVGATSEATSYGAVCQANAPGASAATAPTFDAATGIPTCTGGTLLGE
jgi:type IV pilus assembly protein PilA